MNDAPAVHIVEDDLAALTSMQALLRAHGIPAQGFASAEEFLRAFDSAWRGCALVDLRLPGMSGIELMKTLNSQGSSLAFILVTAYGDVPVAVQAMKAGAIDFLEKPYSEERLLDAVEEGLRAHESGKEIAARRERAREQIERLTSREREVLDLLVRGMTNKEIARQLGRSSRTVEVHRSRIREKTGARSLSDLVRLVGSI